MPKPNKPTQQLALDITPEPVYTRDTFITGPCNHEALKWIEQWPDWPIRFVSVYGETGCGKTHLAHIWQENSQAQFITPEVIARFHPADLIKQSSAFILDIDEIPTEEDWLFHFYNRLKEANGYLMVCSQTPPGQWAVSLPDLRSRLRSIFCLPVLRPDDRIMTEILTKLLREKGIAFKDDVIPYLVNRSERSFSGIYRLSQELDQYTLESKRPLTLHVAREVLEQQDYASV